MTAVPVPQGGWPTPPAGAPGSGHQVPTGHPGFGGPAAPKAPVKSTVPTPPLGSTNGVPNSAEQIVKQFLDTYGLGTLSTWAWNLYTSTGGGTTGMDAINAELPTTAEFKTRFPAYEQLAKEGRAMSPAAMLSYEQSARQIFHAAGLPQGFYDTPQGLAQFMVGDVSSSELQSRVQDAQKALIDSPQDVRDQLQQLYGLSHGDLTAHFLDPKVAEPILTQQFTAAQIATEASRTKFGQIDRPTAENLAQLGVTDASAQSGFNKLGMQQGLFQQQVAGESAVSQSDQLAAQFGGNVSAQQAFLTRQQTRVSQFQQDTAMKAGSKGVTGLGASDQSSPA